MGQVVVIVGQTASGKSTLAKYMEEHDFERIVTYTTRPKRDGEDDGVDYYFLSSDEFAVKAETGFFAETTEYHAAFGHVCYGTSRESLETPHDARKVVVLNPEGVICLKNAGYDIFVVYLDIPQEVLMRRALRRGDTPVEIGRRIAEDAKLFRRLESEGYADICISNPQLLPNQMAEIIRAAV